jgi:hypothetical protein
LNGFSYLSLPELLRKEGFHINSIIRYSKLRLLPEKMKFMGGWVWVIQERGCERVWLMPGEYRGRVQEIQGLVVRVPWMPGESCGKVLAVHGLGRGRAVVIGRDEAEMRPKTN